MPECGNCTMCCKLLGIPELKKQPTKWCTHCDIGHGCKIYEERPTSCREFECLYRTAPDTAKVPLALRPDKCKVVIAPTTTPDVISAHVDPGSPNAWREEPIRTYLAGMAESGIKVVIACGIGRQKTLLERISPGVVGTRTITMSEPDEDGMQWYDPSKDND